MELTEADRPDRPYVERYGPGSFRVNGERWNGSVFLTPGDTVNWPVGDIGQFDAAWVLKQVADADIDLLIVGCGATGQLIPKSVRQPLNDAGIAIEGMDTGAACRTYNLLAVEGRAVAAALVAMPAP